MAPEGCRIRLVTLTNSAPATVAQQFEECGPGRFLRAIGLRRRRSQKYKPAPEEYQYRARNGVATSGLRMIARTRGMCKGLCGRAMRGGVPDTVRSCALSGRCQARQSLRLICAQRGSHYCSRAALSAPHLRRNDDVSAGVGCGPRRRHPRVPAATIWMLRDWSRVEMWRFFEPPRGRWQ
jgi:hypothetical protein